MEALIESQDSILNQTQQGDGAQPLGSGCKRVDLGRRRVPLAVHEQGSVRRANEEGDILELGLVDRCAEDRPRVIVAGRVVVIVAGGVVVIIRCVVVVGWARVVVVG